MYFISKLTILSNLYKGIFYLKIYKLLILLHICYVILYKTMLYYFYCFSFLYITILSNTYILHHIITFHMLFFYREISCSILFTWQNTILQNMKNNLKISQFWQIFSKFFHHAIKIYISIFILYYYIIRKNQLPTEHVKNDWHIMMVRI